MTTVLIPTLMVGLGKTAYDTLSEVAGFLHTTYAPDALRSTAMISFDFMPAPLEAHPSVRHYTITPPAYASEELASLANQSDISTWLDSKYAAYHRDTELDLTERQIARLAFYNHIQHHAANLTRFIEFAVQQTTPPRREQDTSPVLTHVFVNLEDDHITGLILDIVNFLYRGFVVHADIPPRILLHIALPAAISEAQTSDKPIIEKAFATLREIERFMTAFGDAYHRVYPIGSPLSEYAADTERLIDIVFLYPHQPDTPVSTCWADYLMALSDSLETRFGIRYMQHNLVNWANKQQEKRESTGDRYALVTGTYMIRSVMLPVGALRRHWADKLAKRLFDNKLGQPLPRTELTAYIRREWVAYRGRDTENKVISCPSMVDWLLTPPALDEFAALKPAAWLERFFDCDVDHAKIQSLRRESASVLDWRPALDDLQAATPAEVRAKIEQALIQRFGDLEHFTTQTSSPFMEALVALLAVQQQRFVTSLHHFIFRKLNTEGVGLRGVDQLLKDAIARSLTTAAENLRTVYLQVRRLDRMDDLPLRLQRYARGLGRVKTVFGRYSSEAAQYIKQINTLLEQMQQNALLYVFAEFVDDLAATASDLSTQISAWMQALDHPEHSVMQQLAIHAATRPQVRTSVNRLWLEDQDWQSSMFDSIAASIEPDLRAQIQWHQTSDAETESLFSLKIDQHPVALSADAHAQDASVLRERVYREVANKPLDIWREYLNNPRLRHTVLPQVQQFLAGGDIPWRSHVPAVEHALLLPASLFDADAKKTLIDTLNADNLDLHRMDVFLNADPARLLRISAAEGILWRETPEYTRAYAAYAALPASERKRTHIFRPEITIVELEERARLVLGETLTFSSAIVPLLDHPEQIRQFIYLTIFKFINVFTYDGNNEDYAYTQAEKYWWLTRQPGRASLNRALEIFCVHRDSLPYGRPYDPRSGSRLPLPTAKFEQVIEQAISERTARYMNSEQPLPDVEYWRWVESSTRQRRVKNETNYSHAVRLTILDEYMEAVRTELNDSRKSYTREERETRFLLLLTADEMHNEYRKRLMMR